jgi:pyruvate dehydrogenase E1 component beta subunit
MERDPDVVVLGEDIVGGMGTPGGPEAIGGIWSTSVGLFDKFGKNRVIDTPISESAIMGAAAGLALSGKRPVAELMFADFIGVSLDQIWNQMAKFRYMFGGKTKCPAVIRMAYGAGYNAAAQHSQSVHQILTGMPGLKVVMPSTPADVKGLLRTAIRDDDPVIFLEHKALYGISGEVSDDPDFMIPFGHARLSRWAGRDDHFLRPAARLLRSGGRQARRRRHRLRRHRSAHHKPIGRRGNPRFYRSHRPSGCGRRSPATVRACGRYRGAGC